MNALQTHRGPIRAAHSANVRHVENHLEKFNDVATDEERGLLRGFPPSEQFAVKPFASPRPTMAASLTPRQVIERVAEYFHFTASEIVGIKQTRHLVQARFAAVLLVRDRFGLLSLAEIGRKFGGRDHTTIMHALRRIAQMQEADPDFREQVRDLSASLDEVTELAVVDV